MTVDTNVVGLGLDSLERLDVVARVEAEFGIRIPEMVLVELETCREIAAAIGEQLAAVKTNGDPVIPEYYDFAKIPEIVQLDKNYPDVNGCGRGKSVFYGSRDYQQ